MVTISIIGSSGSKGMDIFNNFNDIYSRVADKIEEIYNENEDITIVSGGSSGIDHIAVMICLKYDLKLKLYLPCEFNDDKFYDNGNYNYRYNNGKLLNKLHSDFSKIIGKNTLEQIKKVLKIKENSYEVYEGFLNRNKYVAKSDIIIAATKNSTIDGGTGHTYNLAKTKNKIHLII